MPVKIESTTDTPEQVLAAAGQTKPAANADEGKKGEQEVGSTEGGKQEAAVNAENQEDAGSETETGESATPETQPKPKKPGGFQKKIDKLTRRNYELERQILAYQQQNGAAGSSSNEPPAPKPAAQADGKPDPKKFERHADYVEALTDWKVDQKLQQRDQSAQNQEIVARQTELQESWDEKLEAARAVYPDLEEVLSDDVPISFVTRDLLLESDLGADVAYYLGKNPDEALALAQMPPLAAARQFGKIELKVAAVVEARKAKPAPTNGQGSGGQPKPKPVEPAGRGRSAAAAPDPENMSFSEFKRWRNQQNPRT